MLVLKYKDIFMRLRMDKNKEILKKNYFVELF